MNNAERIANCKLAKLIKVKAKQTPLPTIDTRKRSWISADTWKTINQRHHLRRAGAHADTMQELRKEIKQKLTRDRKERMEKLGERIDGFLRENDYQKAWHSLRPFYKRNPHIFPPSSTEIERIGQEFRTLYQRTAPQGAPLRGLQRFDIPDDAPSEAEISTALRRMRMGKSPGPSGIRTEDLRIWYQQREKNPEPWRTLVSIVTEAFNTGELPTLLHCNILVLIPKSEPGKVRGIGLLETIWKLITTILHTRLSNGITFHPDMHGFLPKRGCSTACMEAKLQMQLMHRIGKPLYQIFIDVSKAYDGLDRERTILILRDYGVGDNTLRILNNFWDAHTIIPKQRGFFGTPFPAERGVTQGDIISPTIFNIVIDCVLHHWYRSMQDNNYPTTTLRFYADDGLLAGDNAVSLQFGVNEIA